MMRYIILLAICVTAAFCQEPAPKQRERAPPPSNADAGLEPAPSPKPEQGPFLLHSLDDRDGICLEGAVNNAGVLHKKCTKSSNYQKFNYAPGIGAFKLGNKCLGIPAIGSLRLMPCPQQAYENHRLTWSCHQSQCCVSSNGDVCVTVKDGGNSWIPDIDVGTSSGIWNMVLYFIMLTLALELAFCLIKLFAKGCQSVCSIFKKQDTGPEIEGPAGEGKPLTA